MKTTEQIVEELVDKCTDAETGTLHIEKYDHTFLESLLRTTIEKVREETRKECWKEGQERVLKSCKICHKPERGTEVCSGCWDEGQQREREKIREWVEKKKKLLAAQCSFEDAVNYCSGCRTVQDLLTHLDNKDICPYGNDECPKCTPPMTDCEMCRGNETRCRQCVLENNNGICDRKDCGNYKPALNKDI